MRVITDKQSAQSGARTTKLNLIYKHICINFEDKKNLTVKLADCEGNKQAVCCLNYDVQLWMPTGKMH